MRKISLLASTALFLLPLSALAQTAPTPAADTGGVEEIIVTATRHKVDLEKVTATVEAVTANTLKAYDITGVQQLPSVVPGFSIIPSGGNNLYLRGIGSASTGFNEAQVAVYVDGVFLANPAMGIYSFNNIDRIEVLKGPQGTLYGRNATGGLVSVTTHDPGPTTSFDASVGYASYNTLTANVYATTPITDTLAANVAVYHSKQSDGWTKNIFTGNEEQKSDETGVESKLVWRPTDTTKVTGSFIYDYNNRDTGYAYEVYPGTIGADGTRYLGKYTDTLRTDPSAPFSAYIGSLKIEQDLGFASLMSLTAFQTAMQTASFASGLPILGLPIAGQSSSVSTLVERNRTYSQEFQLTSAPSDSRLDWVAGAFIYHDNSALALSTYTTCVGSVCTPGFVPTTNTGYPTTRSYSGYGDATYRIFDATHFTAGLRYTDETKGLTGQVTPLAGFPDSVTTLPATTVFKPGQPYAGNPSGIPTSLHFDKLTYRFVLAQDFTDNIHGYISDNRGFKAGAYNANLFSNPPAKPETLDSYEAGLKSELMDHKLRLNMAYFWYDYTNVQVRSTAPPAPVGNALLENAAKEREKGVDIDFSYVPFKRLVINGGFEYLYAKFLSFPGTTCTTPGTKTVNGVLVGTAVAVLCNAAGNQVPYSPPISATLGFTYSMDVAGGTLAVNANDHYTQHYSMAIDDSIRNPAHHVVDASATWTSPEGNYDLQLYGRNLNNEYVYVVGMASSSYAIVPGQPRTIGFTAGYHY